MFKTELFHGDEIEILVEATSWIPVKTLRFIRDPFNYNIFKILLQMNLQVTFGDVGYAGLFIDDEENPRILLKTDLPFGYTFKGEADIHNVSYGEHRLTIKMKSEQGKPFRNTLMEIYVIRYPSLYELTGQIAFWSLLT